jgi:hypothetical protein
MIFSVMLGVVSAACVRDANMDRDGDAGNRAEGVTFVVSAPTAGDATTTYNDKSQAVRPDGAAEREGESGQINKTVPATRAILHDSADDNRIDEISIVLFDDDGSYVRTIGVGGENEPAITDVAGDARRKKFTLKGLADGAYTALFIANSREEVDAYVAANGTTPSKMTLDAFRGGLIVSRTLSKSVKWNAAPGSEGYRPFPMSSREVNFTVPSQRDWTREPVELLRALAKINIRSLVPTGKLSIADVSVCNYNNQGTIVPTLSGQTNPAGSLTTSHNSAIAYNGTAITTRTDGDGKKYHECVDEIFVFEQSSSNPAVVTKTNWGKENFCIILTAHVSPGSGLTSYNQSFRIDLLKDHDNNPDTDPKRLDVLRNHTYEITITKVNSIGQTALMAYDNPPAGLEFEINAFNDNGEGNENTYNGRYQLTTDRDVIVIGPEEGATVSLQVGTDYPQGWKLGSTPSMFTDPQDFIVTGGTTSANNGEPSLLTITVPAGSAWNGDNIRQSSFFITAGALYKRIRFIQLPRAENVTAASADVTDYAGAFWRADQTGERLIAIKPNKTWSAFVLDSAPGGSGDWVAIDTKPSTDTGVGSTPAMNGNDDGFDSRHAVESSASWAMGQTDASGGYFRIGARNAFAATHEHPARYATVLIVDGNITDQTHNASRLLYLRQGHDADYIMRPDAGGGDNGTMATRPLARRFSPYNLTAGEFLGGTATQTQSPAVGARKGVFTDYPTKAGAQFQYAPTYGVYAFNPATPTSTPDKYNAAETAVDERTNWNAISHIYETCPRGYRRPTHGDYTKPTAALDVNMSELSQSLFSNTGTGMGNSVWGYYADGYFDRHTPETSASGKARSAVNPLGYNVAYAGLLFYNTATNASIFLPASSSRTVPQGGLLNAGAHASFWSTSLTDSPVPNVRLLTLSNPAYGEPLVEPESTGPRNAAHTIRCVEAPDYGEEIDPQLLMAPPGVIGIRHSDLMKLRQQREILQYNYFDPSITLTLRGSSTYRGTRVERIATNDPQIGSLEDEPVYILYFKWGSTIGLTGQYDYISGSGYSFNDSDVVWINPGSGVNITNYGSIPAGIPTGYNYGDNITYDPLTSRGDPCRWVDGAAGTSEWATPTGNPWTLSNGTRNFTPFGTYTATPQTYGTTWAVAKSTWGASSQWTTSPGIGTIDDNGTVYLPAAGQRSSAGTTNMNIYNPTGFYWTSTAESAGYGYDIYFSRTNVNPAYRSLVNVGIPVRCVKPTTLTDVVYAPPGVIGIRKSDYDALVEGSKTVGDGTYSLTIKGSGTYKGTWVETDIALGPEFASNGLGGLEPDPVYAVYFKWGSLVGAIGRPGVFGANDVVWANPDFNGSITGNYADITPANVDGNPGVGYNILENLAAGQGDPCNFVNGANKYRRSGWITPYGTSPTDGSIVTPDATMFLPAAGFRAGGAANGLFEWAGSRGAYWTSTSHPSSGAYHVAFNDGEPKSVTNGSFDSGMTVRCVVRTTPVVEITGP